MFDWDDLRFFSELAHRGSLSGASRRLRTEHSTVARRIAGLEASLGLKLFDRLPRGYALTAEGERLLERLAPLEEAIASVERLSSGAEAVEGVVRVSAPPTFASHWLVPRLAALRARHPGIVLDVIGAVGAANLARGEAELALRLSKPAGGGLIVRRLGALRFGLYGARTYLAKHREPQWRFLGYDDELASSPQQRWVARVAGARPFVLKTNDLASLLSGVRAGLGLAALPHVIAQDERELTCVAESDEATRELWLVVHPDVRRSTRVRAVMDFLVELAAPLRDAATGKRVARRRR